MSKITSDKEIKIQLDTQYPDLKFHVNLSVYIDRGALSGGVDSIWKGEVISHDYLNSEEASKWLEVFGFEVVFKQKVVDQEEVESLNMPEEEKKENEK